MTNNERDLLLVVKDLLEICRIKCSPTDEVWRADGVSNEQVMVAAMATIKRVEFEKTKKPKAKAASSFSLAEHILATAVMQGRLSNAEITRRNGGVRHQFLDDIGGCSQNYQ
jgi:hypothetical protein